MIAIINYQLNDNTALIDAFDSIRAKYQFTNSEQDILNSDAIILPDTTDVKNALRQLHLLNLFSMIRMLKKPILGIARGFELMCEFAGKNHSACLGLLPIDIELMSEERVGELFSLQIIKQTTLLKGVNSNDKFYFEREITVGQSENASSIIIGTNNSASFENNNFYGVLFLPEKSGESGKKILKNFVSISKMK